MILTPRRGCTFRIPIVDLGGSAGISEFRKSTLGAPVAVELEISSFFEVIYELRSIEKWHVNLILIILLTHHKFLFVIQQWLC